jgi:hypothetical protein
MNTTVILTPQKPKAMSSWQARWFHFAVWSVILTLFVVFLRAVEPILLPFRRGPHGGYGYYYAEFMRADCGVDCVAGAHALPTA